MNKPVFKHCNTVYTISWILTVPILLDICTACTLFSFWLVWLLFGIVFVLSVIRIFHGFAQKCYKFSWGLIAQLLLGGAILTFFQLSFNHVIDTPLSNSVTPDIIEIAKPDIIDDSIPSAGHKAGDEVQHLPVDHKIESERDHSRK